jgi:hypothetical protein
MREFKASSLSEAPPSDGKVEVIDVHFDLHKLEVTVGLYDQKVDKKVTFEEVCGFRALDEGGLTAWWSHITLKDGWCFEVIQGGWFEQEAQRKDFLSGNAKFYREFLIIGVDFCLSVISKDYPSVTNINRT